MTSVATYFCQRHDILVNLWRFGIYSLERSSMLAEVEKLDEKIFDMLKQADEPEFVGYERNGSTHVVQIDYHFKTIDWVEFLGSEEIDKKASQTVIESPEWHPASI